MKKIKLSDDVLHSCKTNVNIVDGRILKGKFILELRKKAMWSSGEFYSYKFTKLFDLEIDGRCLDNKLD